LIGRPFLLAICWRFSCKGLFKSCAVAGRQHLQGQGFSIDAKHAAAPCHGGWPRKSQGQRGMSRIPGERLNWGGHREWIWIDQQDVGGGLSHSGVAPNQLTIPGWRLKALVILGFVCEGGKGSKFYHVWGNCGMVLC
jgi:hypothetical protein